MDFRCGEGCNYPAEGGCRFSWPSKCGYDQVWKEDTLQMVDETVPLIEIHSFLHSFIHSFIPSFIHSFRSFLQRLFMFATTQKRSRHSTDTAPEFHAEASQTTVREGLAQGPYVAARARFEPTTLRSKGFDSTYAPPRLTTTTRDNQKSSKNVVESL